MSYKNLSRFQKYCNNKTIAIVGNSSSIFNKSYGKDIDSHDVVIRFNWVIEKNLHKWSANLGTKFNVYVYAIKSPGRFRNMAVNKLFSNKSFIIRIRHDDEHYIKSQQIKLSDKIKNKLLYYNKQEFDDSISVEDFKESRDASAGAMTLQFILDCINFKHISLYGFDFFKSAEDTPRLSNEFKSFFYNHHNKKDEEKFFISKINEYKGTGKLKFYT